MCAADIDPYYSETESDVVTEVGEYADEPWVTGEGPLMYTFPYYDDFVAYYRIYNTSDALWYAWNAAQDFDAEDFAEILPEYDYSDDEINED